METWEQELKEFFGPGDDAVGQWYGDLDDLGQLYGLITRWKARHALPVVDDFRRALSQWLDDETVEELSDEYARAVQS